MGNNTDRPVGQMGDVGGVFRPHRVIVECLGWLPLWEQDQTVHLPEIFRAVHSSYLANDFWLNSASQLGPRFYYTEGVAFAANFIPIPAIIFLLFVCPSCVTNVVVAFAARDLSGFTVAALVMTSLSVSISPFWFGHFAGLSNATRCVVPSTLGRAFSRVCRLAGDPRRTGVRRFGLRPGDPGALGSR